VNISVLNIRYFRCFASRSRLHTISVSKSAEPLAHGRYFGIRSARHALIESHHVDVHAHTILGTSAIGIATVNLLLRQKVFRANLCTKDVPYCKMRNGKHHDYQGRGYFRGVTTQTQSGSGYCFLCNNSCDPQGTCIVFQETGKIFTILHTCLQHGQVSTRPLQVDSVNRSSLCTILLMPSKKD
jgi:hypothetical protein